MECIHQIRLINVLQRHRFLTDDRRQRFQPDGAAAEMLYYCREHTSVHRVKPQLVHVKASERSVGNALVDFSVAQHEREVAHTLQKPVCDTRCSA